MSERVAYDYSVPMAYCEKHGLRWADELVPSADALFVRLKLTQQQVDALTCHHAWTVNHLFDPRSYGWVARIYLAARFLFGLGGRKAVR